MEDRIVELETLATYQAKLIRELDEVLQDVANRLGKIEQRVRRIEDAQQQIHAEMEPHNTPPPHY
ncbi:MAG: SlyX family protein [Acidobacteriota bacterium]